MASLKKSIETWDVKLAESAAKQALDANIAPGEAVEYGLGKGMETISLRFDEAEIFLPQVLAASKAMEAAMKIFEPAMVGGATASRGTVVLGTVLGDIHEIGKNVVAAMLKGAGFNVLDVGRDVAPEKFIEAAKESKANVVGASALMTTTVVVQKDIVDQLKAENVNVKTIFGGAACIRRVGREHRWRPVLPVRCRGCRDGQQPGKGVIKMAAARPISIFDAYERFKAGKKVSESDWDYGVIPTTATAMKEKYNIKFGKEIIPEDKDLMNRLFQAGMDMLVTAGFYNADLGRVLYVTEEEIREGIKKTPKSLVLGQYRDVAHFEPRRGNAARKPVIQGGPTGAPVSEEVFIQVMQSYAQEAVVDTLVNGVMATIEGHPATTNTPWEIRAMTAELRAVQEARIRAHRPYMAI